MKAKRAGRFARRAGSAILEPFQRAFLDRCERDVGFRRRMEHARCEGRRILAAWYPPNATGSATEGRP